MINQLERIQRDFLWGSDLVGRKIHWVGWKEVCRPYDQEGIGIKPLRITNGALLNKWLWRFGNERGALWRRLVAAKYGEEGYGWRSGEPGGLGCSMWRDIYKGIESFFNHIRFKTNNGESVKFWQD